jgi:RNA polymerase sigma factor (sigma-70 family)
MPSDFAPNKLTLADVQAMAAEEGVEVPELLDSLAARGYEINDDFDSRMIDESVERAMQQIRETEDLSAFTLFRRQAANHRILSREEEAQYTHRYLFLKETVAALEEQRQRLVDRRTEAVDHGDTGTVADLDAAIAQLDTEIAEAKRLAQETKEEFLAYNHRLAIHLAMRQHEKTGRKADLMDLIQQGELGMLEAFDRFDPTRGYKFSTFASWYINQYISAWTFEQVSTIRVPTHRWRDARMIANARTRIVSETGEDPTLEVLAADVGKSPKKVVEILAAEEMARPTSLHQPIGDDEDDAVVGDMIADKAALNPEEVAVRNALQTIFADAFERVLTARERRVLQLRFGLYDGEPRTLEWIGRRMGISRERVRQIEERAFARLRSDPAIRQLIDGEAVGTTMAVS